MDDLGLNRAIELLEYWHRESQPAEERQTTWELDEATARNQFHAVAGEYLGGAEMKIPPEMRDAIKWAEEMKAKMKGGNG